MPQIKPQNVHDPFEDFWGRFRRVSEPCVNRGMLQLTARTGTAERQLGEDGDSVGATARGPGRAQQLHHGAHSPTRRQGSTRRSCTNRINGQLSRSFLKLQSTLFKQNLIRPSDMKNASMPSPVLAPQGGSGVLQCEKQTQNTGKKEKRPSQGGTLSPGLPLFGKSLFYRRLLLRPGPASLSDQTQRGDLCEGKRSSLAPLIHTWMWKKNKTHKISI